MNTLSLYFTLYFQVNHFLPSCTTRQEEARAVGGEALLGQDKRQNDKYADNHFTANEEQWDWVNDGINPEPVSQN